MAWLLDALCLAAASMVLRSVIGLLAIFSVGVEQAVQIILFFSLSIAYRVASEWYWRGQTIGKKLLRLRVIDAQGFRLHFSQIVIRNLLRFVDALPLCYLVGGIACVA